MIYKQLRPPSRSSMFRDLCRLALVGQGTSENIGGCLEHVRKGESPNGRHHHIDAFDGLPSRHNTKSSKAAQHSRFRNKQNNQSASSHPVNRNDISSSPSLPAVANETHLSSTKLNSTGTTALTPVRRPVFALVFALSLALAFLLTFFSSFLLAFLSSSVLALSSIEVFALIVSCAGTGMPIL